LAIKLGEIQLHEEELKKEYENQQVYTNQLQSIANLKKAFGNTLMDEGEIAKQSDKLEKLMQ